MPYNKDMHDLIKGAFLVALAAGVALLLLGLWKDLTGQYCSGLGGLSCVQQYAFSPLATIGVPVYAFLGGALAISYISSMSSEVDASDKPKRSKRRSSK